MKITILMYVLNGVDFLGEQLQSLFKQDICEKAEMDILVWDDGSTDKTRDLLDRYQREGKLTFHTGSGIGRTKGYWELMKKAEKADFYAFCEQDDVWFPNKLSRAVKYLETKAILEGEETEVSEGPILYCGECTVTNAKLKTVNFKRNPANKFTDFEHSLVYSSMPGCTYVFNRSALEKLIKFDPGVKENTSYEDLARNIIYIEGSVVFDRVPVMFWRRNKGDKFSIEYQGGIIGRIKRQLDLMTGKNVKAKSRTAKALLAAFGENITEHDKKASLKQVAEYAENPVEKERLIQNPKFVTGSFDDKWFRTAVRTDRL